MRRPSERGFSLIEILIATSVLGMLAMGVITTFQQLAKQQFRSNMAAQSDVFRRNMIAHLQNEQAWQRTMNDAANTSMACLRNSTSCTGAGGPFRLRDSQNGMVYDAMTSPTAGLTADGRPCNTFNAVDGDDVCLLRMELSWTPICSGTCMSPQVQVRGGVRYKPQSKQRTIAFNTENYSFTMIRNVAGASGGLAKFNTSIHNFGFVPQWSGVFPFDMVMSDPGGNLSGTTHTFTATEAGLYSISASVCYITNATGPLAWCRSELFAGGVVISNNLSRMISNSCENTMSAPAYLNVGQTVYVISTVVNPDFGAGNPHEATCPQQEWSNLSVAKIR